jgi:hypothetical protein
MDENQIVETKPGVREEFVDNSHTEETDALMESVIKDVESEWQDEDLAALPDGAEPSGDDTGGDTQAAADGEPTESAETDDDRSISRLVQREVELRTKEEAFKAREAAVAQVEQENTQLRQQLADLEARIPNDFIDQLRVNPWETLEQVGYDPEHIVRVVLAQKLTKQGKDIPKELRDDIRAAENDFKQRQLDKRQVELEQKITAQRFVEKVETEARQYIRAMSELKPEFSKDAPTVAKVAKADPERVYAEIMDEIGRDASARRREPGAQLISYAEAARRLEKRWGDMRKLLSSDSPEDASTTAAKTPERAQQTGASPAGKPANKTAVKPLIPQQSKTQEELEQEGIDAALAEFKRVEMARRKGVQPLRR